MNKTLPICLIFLLSLYLVSQPVLAQKIWIEVVAISSRMKHFPIKIYYDETGACGDDVDRVLKKTLEVAVVLLRKSVWRFMEEYDGHFDDFINFRLELTDNPHEALIIVNATQLGEGTAGVTEITISDEGVIPPVKISYDCEVVLRPTVPAFNVVLHELLHALGLGHTNFKEINGEYELMFPAGYPNEPTIYVSSLDLYALYQIWFKNYQPPKGEWIGKISLPGYLKFYEVKPYLVEFQELEEMYRELHEKYGVLESEVQGLKSDLVILDRRIGLLEGQVAEMNRTIKDVMQEVAFIGGDVKELKSVAKKHEAEISNLNNSLQTFSENVTTSFKTLSAQVSDIHEDLVSFKESVSQELMAMKSRQDDLARELDALRKVFIITTLAFGICMALLTRALTVHMKKHPS